MKHLNQFAGQFLLPLVGLLSLSLTVKPFVPTSMGNRWEFSTQPLKATRTQLSGNHRKGLFTLMQCSSGLIFNGLLSGQIR